MSKPEWLRIRPPEREFSKVLQVVESRKLSTVCQAAHCPNLSECWSSGTATFMVMGDVCTRGCRFCNVKKGSPSPLDTTEPQRLADAVKALGIAKHIVITSVDRDDLPDQGAGHFAACIRSLKGTLPGLGVEVLIPDFRGDQSLLGIVLDAKPDVLAHNLETVERLQGMARDRRASYQQSLGVLRNAKAAGYVTKTSLMLGLGEKEEEVLQAMDDAREVGVDIITFGQYLQPSERHLPVIEFIRPEKFKYYQEKAYSMGFRGCASGPFVRSSYKAGELRWNS
jgi:lipoyl synthase